VIETYVFLAMFALQILAGSVIGPALYIRRVRAEVASFPAERFAELFPGVDKTQSAERFATKYRALNTGVAVLGLLVLGWLFSYMLRPDWNEEKMPLLMAVYCAYFFAQIAPAVLNSRKAARYTKALRSSMPDGKRKAVLQRRRLFDFVSPFIVFLAALIYVLFAAFVLYVRQHPYPGFGGLTNIVVVTAIYALSAVVVFRFLYGKKPNPLMTHTTRMYAISLTVKTFVYMCIGVTLFCALVVTLGVLNLQRWVVVAVGAFFLINVLLTCKGPVPPPRQSGGDGSGSDSGPAPGTQHLSA